MIVIDETKRYFDTIQLMNQAGQREHGDVFTRRLVIDNRWLLFISTYHGGWEASISCIDGHQMTKPEFNLAVKALMYHRVVPRCHQVSASSFPHSIVMHFHAGH